MKRSSVVSRRLDKLANTASTKSGASKQARGKAAEERRGTTSYREDVPENVWRIAVIVIFLVAAFFRLYDLNLVPLHHDEGVNGNFLVRLVRRQGARRRLDRLRRRAVRHGPALLSGPPG